MCCVTQQNRSLRAPAASWADLEDGIEHPVGLTFDHFSDTGNSRFAKAISHLLPERTANPVLRRPILAWLQSIPTQGFLAELNDSSGKDLIIITIAIAGQH